MSDEEGRLVRADAVVVGCGVIGLTAAISLREAGLEVGIVTAGLPPSTTSSVAAAIWYPYKAYPEDRVLSWGSRTYEVFEGLSDFPETGVLMRAGVELWHKKVHDPWWAEAVPRVRRCYEDELPPGYTDGHAFTAPVVEMPIYLTYLMDRFVAAGGSVEQRALSSLEEVAGDARVVVNCVGLGARDLMGDASMQPIRGQIVRVRNPGLDRFALDEENPEGVTYIVPRSNDCILGGTADEGEWDLEPDPETASGILRRCTKLEPRLAGAEVLEHKVGLRPGRQEIRLEAEEGPNDAILIHNYGHGGSGVTLSWGCAEETLRIALQHLSTSAGQQECP
ncbi:MAG: FAD-binding oxidoreductase [Rubrobacteraceae bacterium]|nr:FAD-binding oxidoreductase [Rubrobacteraceae bacterium]